MGVVALVFPLLFYIGRLGWQITFQRVTSAVILLFGILLFFNRAFFTTSSIAQPPRVWTVVRKSELDADLQGIFFSDPNLGWAVGYSNTILHTRDSGKTWESLYINESSHHHELMETQFKAVNFINTKKGWAVGGQNIGQFGSHNGVIIHTKDGGKTWLVQADNITSYLNDLVFINDREGWVVGGWFQQGEILHTTDGGQTWISQLTTDRGLNSIFFTTKKEGWAVGDGGIFLHTEDFGRTWQRKSIRQYEGYNFNDIVFVSETEGWIVSDSGLILHTQDGGESWQTRKSGTNDPLKTIRFVSPKEGWIVGWKGLILHTTDSGMTWEHQFSPTTKTLNGLSIVHRDGIPWVAGESGIVLRYERSQKDLPAR